MDIQKLIAAQRAYFETGATRGIAARRQALQHLQASVRRHEQALCNALRADLGKSAVESYMTEIGIVLGEIRFALHNLKRWMRLRRVSTLLFAWPARSRICYEPLGVVLIVAPWNYPLQLTLLPLVGALAAGNCVVLKPSPSASATAAVLSQIVGECFTEEQAALVPHAPQVMEELLAQRFDHIFYTGGGAFGREIMARAAAHLTPVTLELGGKSPCVVGREADLALAARRIVWGKTLNAGQTCVAPDFLLVHESVCDRLVEELQRAVERQWGSDPRFAMDYPRMIDAAHTRRVAELLSTAGGKVVCGGEVLEEERYVAPTIVLNPDPQSRLMREEIFAPILPVQTFAELSEAVHTLLAADRPLALYYFGDEREGRQLCDRVPSGGAALNDVVMQVSSARLPFGGVGASGMGRYHGEASFECFSNRRSYFLGSRLFDLPLRYAPYPKWLLGLLRRLMD